MLIYKRPNIISNNIINGWEHSVTNIPRQVILVTRDLELRWRFLMQGHLPQDEEQFVILRILPAYQSQYDY